MMSEMIASVLLGAVLGACPVQSSTSSGLPCGYVAFRPHGPPFYRDGTAYESIVLTVRFSDGHTEIATLPFRRSALGRRRRAPVRDDRSDGPFRDARRGQSRWGARRRLSLL